MANIGYRALNAPPSVPLSIGDQSIPVPARWTDLFQYIVQLSSWLTRSVDIVNNLLRGKFNCTGSVTITHDVATTTLTDVNIGGNSTVLLMPTTAHAAAELATLYIDTFAKGSCVIHHANNAQTDRVFGYAVIG